MRHTPLDQLTAVAKTYPDPTRPALTRSERLERWAMLLEREPDRRLRTFSGTEYEPARARDVLQSAGSSISVAYEDPILRAAGLQNDTYGEAKRFFELSDHQLHAIVCYCHFGPSVTAAVTARCVRAVAERAQRRGLFARLWEAMVR